MDVDISKWQKTAHGSDGDSTSKQNNLPYENAAASTFINLGGLPSVTIMQINLYATQRASPKQPSARLFAALNTEVK